MKTVTPALAALINTGVFTAFDLYTITLAGGAGALRFTSADVDIAFGGNRWTSKDARVEQRGARALARWATGLDVDQWQVTFIPRARHDLTGAAFPDRIGAMPWLQAAFAGALDSAAVLIERAFFPAPPAHPLPPGGAVPTGTIILFRGTVAEVDVNTSMAVLTINDARQILTTQMPRNLYQAACRHRLFSPGCKLNAASYVRNAALGGASSRAVLVAIVTPPPGKTFQLGRVTVTSGRNAGFSRTIAAWDGRQTFKLQSPFPFDFAAGDAAGFYPGCNKTTATCAGFGNLVNYGGNPYVPIPETTA